MCLIFVDYNFCVYTVHNVILIPIRLERQAALFWRKFWIFLEKFSVRLQRFPVVPRAVLIELLRYLHPYP